LFHSEQEANLLLAGEIQGTVTSSIELKEEDSSIDRRRSLRLVEKESTRDDWSLARTLSRKYDKESAFLGDDSRPSSSGGTSNHSKRTRTSRISEEDKSKLLLTYPFEAKGPGRISITLGDIDRLPPGEFLNDSIIDFYYK
jgi:Ulp1 family protease